MYIIHIYRWGAGQTSGNRHLGQLLGVSGLKINLGPLNTFFKIQCF